TTVTFDRFGDAMYFSKAIIPFVKKPDAAPPIWRHIGIYAFRAETLAQYVSLEMGPFEKAEELEQLRALENGIKMRVVPCDYRGRTHWSIDSPDDLREAEAILAREGELLPRYDGTARVE
ncbi:MAG: cytidylyltransferase domain-containing protein, partial [Tagaea sp.]